MKNFISNNKKLLLGILATVLCMIVLCNAIVGMINFKPAELGDLALEIPTAATKPAPKPTQPLDTTPPSQPEAPAPEAPAPEAPAPETPAPEAPAPETPAPETPAPETPTPETPAPETPEPEEPKPNVPYDSFDEFFTGTLNVSAATSVQNQTANGVVSAPVTVGGNSVTAEIPQGVTMADNATSLTLSVKPMDKSNTGLTTDDNQIVDALDVHMEGVAATNTVPMRITLKHYLPMGLNNGNVKLYHVEQGGAQPMTQVDDPANHNEFSYDPLTGTVVLSMASFSEVTLVADAHNTWDGTSADGFAGGTGTEEDPFLISTAHELAYFRDQVDAGNKFEGQFVKLNNSINLSHVNFDPIGYGYECQKYMSDGRTFNGTFDGGNRTITGLYQNGWELGSKYSYSMAGGGLFASVVDATIKNLKITDANIIMECVDMGILVGYSQGNCTYENIGIYHSKIANYQRATGGLVGEVSPRRNADGSLMFPENTHTFKNIDIGFNVVVGSLWGDFDAPVGGVIGARWDDNDSTKVVMEDLDVACQLDVYCDITAAYRWHAYRRAGMLIGNTDTPAANGKTAQIATADFLTCRNVRVYWGDWTDYHYCQFTNDNNPGRNYPWVRVEAGENCSAYSNPRYGQPFDNNNIKVTDSNHTHKPGDTCHLSMPFAQLYGGGQGVYGAVSHEGVTMSTPVYTVTYIVEGEIDEIIYITDNSVLYTLKPAGEHMQWIDREGQPTTTIDAGNTTSRVFHYDDADKLIAHFVDIHGHGITHVEFTSTDTKIEEPPVPHIEGYYGRWEAYTLPSSTSIVIKPVYTLEEEYEELSKNMDAEMLFDYLSEGKDVVMSQSLSSSQGNASKKECAIITDGSTDKDARLNLNGYKLHYDFAANGNKNWLIFDIRGGSSLTVSGGIYHGGTLAMHVTALNKNASAIVFDLDPGATLVLEKGTIIEVQYLEGRADDVSMFGMDHKQFSLNQEDFPYLQYTHDTENCIKRIVVLETTVLTNQQAQ